MWRLLWSGLWICVRRLQLVKSFYFAFATLDAATSKTPLLTGSGLISWANLSLPQTWKANVTFCSAVPTENLELSPPFHNNREPVCPEGSLKKNAGLHHHTDHDELNPETIVLSALSGPLTAPFIHSNLRSTNIRQESSSLTVWLFSFSNWFHRQKLLL